MSFHNRRAQKPQLSTLINRKHVFLMLAAFYLLVACSSQPLNHETFADLVTMESVSDNLGIPVSKIEIPDSGESEGINHHVFTGVYGLENQYESLYYDGNGDRFAAVFICQFFTDRHAREILNDLVLSEKLNQTGYKIGNRSAVGTMLKGGISGIFEATNVVAFQQGRLVAVIEVDASLASTKQSDYLSLANLLAQKL